MFKRLQKIVCLACTALLISANLLSLQNAFAETVTTDLDIGDSSSSFNVESILSVNTDNEGTQEHAYFGDSEVSPAVLFVLQVINFITKMVGVVAMLLIVIGGLMMIVSQGEEALLQKGKDTLTAAIFGIVIVMFSYIIVRFVQSLFYLPTPSS